METKHTSYQIQVGEGGVLLHRYYGRSLLGSTVGDSFPSCERGFSGNPYDLDSIPGYSLDVLPQEYSTFGGGDLRVVALQAEDENGSMTTDLRYVGYEITEGKYRLPGLPYVRGEEDPVKTLTIHLEDRYNGLRVSLSYGVFEDKDVICRSALIENGSKKPLTLHKAASLCLDFPSGEWELISFAGGHCKERRPQRQALCQDIITVESKRGMSSHHNNPFVILARPSTNEFMGEACGVMLAYSGNHAEEVEVDQAGLTRIVSGIHPEGFRWLLDPGESFVTPEAILSYSYEGLNGLSQNFHSILREDVCPKEFQGPRPVLLNSWEASYFDFTEESLYALALEAKELGMDMLVVDDGWFGERNDDYRGLGDWFVNEEKLKGGLGKLSKQVHDLGLSLGLWFEPEMINEDSNLYRAHPDWAIQEPGRPSVLARHQLVLDVSRPEVRDYLFGCIGGLIEEAQLDYIKWDFNRSLAGVYSQALPKDRQGEVSHRFILGTYELLGRIREKYPHVLIEGCAGGGGRFDAGMLFYCPQIWTSDNTDPLCRAEIQRGTSYGYPASAMGCHVSASPNHQTGRSTPLSTRAVVAAAGMLGYELNPGLLSEEEKAEIREQVARYKAREEIVRLGKYYRLGEGSFNTHYRAWSFVSPDQSKVLVSILGTQVVANAPFPYVRLQGLSETAMYKQEGSDEVYSGAVLMYAGLSLDQMRGDYPVREILFEKVEEKEL